LDLDWEWSKSVEDPPTRDAIVSLLAALRTRLGNRLITTDAFPSQASLWVQSGAFKYVDRLNVMVYDLVTCCATTWFNGAISGQASFQWALQQYQAAGAPIGKINLGIPFYGWQFADGSTGPNQPRNPSADPAKRWQISYAAIANQYFQSPNISYFDSSARASWIRTTDGWITYDNEQSVAEKIRIIRESGVGGSSVWELSHDYFPDRSPQHPLLEAVKKSWPGINGSSVGP
jgi:chitinase